MAPITAGTAPAQQPSDVDNTEFLSWHCGEHSKFHGELFTRQLPSVKQCQDRCRDKTKACVRTSGVSVCLLVNTQGHTQFPKPQNSSGTYYLGQVFHIPS